MHEQAYRCMLDLNAETGSWAEYGQLVNATNPHFRSRLQTTPGTWQPTLLGVMIPLPLICVPAPGVVLWPQPRPSARHATPGATVRRCAGERFPALAPRHTGPHGRTE